MLQPAQRHEGQVVGRGDLPEVDAAIARDRQAADEETPGMKPLELMVLGFVLGACLMAIFLIGVTR